MEKAWERGFIGSGLINRGQSVAILGEGSKSWKKHECMFTSHQGDPANLEHRGSTGE